MPKKIIAGTMGFSGTMSINWILIKVGGTCMVDNLNGINVNIVFTSLFKDPEWYKTAL